MTFRSLVRGPKATEAGIMSVSFVSAEDAPTDVRIAFSVPVRIGSAVVRNRTKRRIRAIIRQNGDRTARGAYLIKVHSRLDELNYGELSTLVGRLMHESSIMGSKRVAGKNKKYMAFI